MRYVVDFVWSYVSNCATRAWIRSKKATPAEQKALALVATALGILATVVKILTDLAHAFGH